MGGKTFNDHAYLAAASARARRGEQDFAYSAAQQRIPRDQRKAAPILDPYGATVREARDSAEHPNSTPIAVLFDVTGSMRAVPATVQRKLPDLVGLLIRGGYVDDPQLLVGGIGDDYFDRVPLQIGQFESDNRIDEQLRQLYLEGGGGGDKREGYALAAYFLNTRVKTDAFEKRGKRGYLFIIGDEKNKTALTATAIQQWIGDDVTEDLSIESVYAKLREQWNVFYVLPKMTAYYDDPDIEQHWRPLVGERFLRLDDPAAVAELIAVTVGLTENAITLDEGATDAGAAGASVSRALSVVSGAGTGEVAARGGRLPEDF